MSHNVCIGKIRGKQVFPVGKERSDKSSEREEERKAREGFYFSAGSIRIVNGRTTRVSSVRRGGEWVKEMRGGVNK